MAGVGQDAAGHRTADTRRGVGVRASRGGASGRQCDGHTHEPSRDRPSARPGRRRVPTRGVGPRMIVYLDSCVLLAWAKGEARADVTPEDLAYWDQRGG